MNKKIVFSALLFIVPFLYSCSGKIEKERIITVTIEPQKYFAEQIAGDLFEIVTMVPAGTSPETYDPSPVQMANLAKSTAYFQIGKIGFEETWIEKIKINNPELPIFDNGTGIQYLTSAHECNHDEAETSEGEHHHHHGGVDPHTWSSPKEALIIAENMFKAFVEIDKKNEAIYSTNFNKLKSEIQKTDSIVSSLMAQSGNKSFVIYHPALTYFARDYGLNQVCIEIDGKEPSPEQLRQLVETSRSEVIKVIFIQQEFDQKNAETIAAETGCKLVVINPLSYNWSDEIIKIAKVLANE